MAAVGGGEERGHEREVHVCGYVVLSTRPASVVEGDSTGFAPFAESSVLQTWSCAVTTCGEARSVPQARVRWHILAAPLTRDHDPDTSDPALTRRSSTVMWAPLVWQARTARPEGASSAGGSPIHTRMRASGEPSRGASAQPALALSGTAAGAHRAQIRPPRVKEGGSDTAKRCFRGPHELAFIRSKIFIYPQFASSGKSLCCESQGLSRHQGSDFLRGMVW